MKFWLELLVWYIYVRYVNGFVGFHFSDAEEDIIFAMPGQYHVNGKYNCYFSLATNVLVLNKKLNSTRSECIDLLCYKQRYCTHYSYVPNDPSRDTTGICYLFTNFSLNSIPHIPDAKSIKWKGSECGLLTHRTGPYISWTSTKDKKTKFINGIMFNEIPHRLNFRPLLITQHCYIPPREDNVIDKSLQKIYGCKKRCIKNIECTHYNWNQADETCVLMNSWVDESYPIHSDGDRECGLIPIRKDWWLMRTFGVHRLVHPYQKKIKSSAPHMSATINFPFFLCLLFSCLQFKILI